MKTTTSMTQAPHTGAINAHLGAPGDSTMLAYGENERLTVPFVRPEDVIASRRALAQAAALPTVISKDKNVLGRAD